MSGFLLLHRKFKQNFLWLQKRVFSRWEAWEDLFSEANHAQATIIFEGRPLLVKRGQHITSQLKLAKRWRWSRGKVERFLKLLQKEGMIQVQNMDRKASKITICNYDTYQGVQDNTQGINNNEKQVIYIPESEEVFSLWNSQEVITHRELTSAINTALKKALTKWGLEDIRRAIRNYGEVISKPGEYYFTYRWTLEQFLTRKNAISQFENELCLTNFRKNNGHSTGGHKPTNGTGKRGGISDFSDVEKSFIS